MTRPVRRSAAFATWAAVAGLALSACTSGSTAETPSSSDHPTTTAVAVMPATSAATSTGAAMTSTQARMLVDSAVHVDAEGFQSGSFASNGPAQRMPHVVQFTTPSGNIRCTWAPALPSDVTCQVGRYDFTPPRKPADCRLNWSIGLIELTAKAATLGGCVGGPSVTYSSKVLPYGRAIEALGIGCYSASTALTCVDMSSGRGFSVSRKSFTTY